MDVHEALDELDLTGAAYAAPVAGGQGCGVDENEPVTPASVMKIQVALTVEQAIASGAIDGSAQRVMRADARTPGAVGISLMQDEVSMSVRDLVALMLTISDNVATDELIASVGLARVNRTTAGLGMAVTTIASDLRTMLDGMAREVGFADYRALAAHDPATDGPPTQHEISQALAASAALDPARGSRTTARETAMLLQAIWTDRAGDPAACARVREQMRRQLIRHRIASGFPPGVTVAAKSGGLMGVVRNEAGVVTYPDGTAYVVAVFIRSRPDHPRPAAIDTAIGTVARLLVERLR